MSGHRSAPGSACRRVAGERDLVSASAFSAQELNRPATSCRDWGRGCCSTLWGSCLKRPLLLVDRVEDLTPSRARAPFVDSCSKFGGARADGRTSIRTVRVMPSLLSDGLLDECELAILWAYRAVEAGSNRCSGPGAGTNGYRRVLIDD